MEKAWCVRVCWCVCLCLEFVVWSECSNIYGLKDNFVVDWFWRVTNSSCIWLFVRVSLYTQCRSNPVTSSFNSHIRAKFSAPDDVCVPVCIVSLPVHKRFIRLRRAEWQVYTVCIEYVHHLVCGWFCALKKKETFTSQFSRYTLLVLSHFSLRYRYYILSSFIGSTLWWCV